jgi:ERCC4-type nuclease
VEEEGMTKQRRTTKKDVLSDSEEVIRRVFSGTKAEKMGLVRRWLESESLDCEAIEFDISEEDVGRGLNLELIRQIATNTIVHELTMMKRIDHREHWLMRQYLSELGFEIVHLNTGSGDMASRKVSVERKEDDLLPSLFDQRRLRQLGAMREEAEHSFLVITKDWDEIKLEASKKGMSMRILIGYIASLCAVGYPPIFMPDKYDASLLIERLVEKIEDDNHRLFVPRPSKAKPQNYRDALLEGLPKVGLQTRRKLVAHFGTLNAITSASVDELKEVDGIGENLAKRLHSIFNA